METGEGPASIEIEVAGQTRVLRCTPEAALSISDRFGGLVAALLRVQACDLDAYAFIIEAGLGLAQRPVTIADHFPATASQTAVQRRPGSLRALVYETGTETLHGPLTRFLETLNNGGRLLAPKAGE